VAADDGDTDASEQGITGVGLGHGVRVGSGTLAGQGLSAGQGRGVGRGVVVAEGEVAGTSSKSIALYDTSHNVAYLMVSVYFNSTRRVDYSFENY
jgi:hypothetical protein